MQINHTWLLDYILDETAYCRGPSKTSRVDPQAYESPIDSLCLIHMKIDIV